MEAHSRKKEQLVYDLQGGEVCFRPCLLEERQGGWRVGCVER